MSSILMSLGFGGGSEIPSLTSNEKPKTRQKGQLRNTASKPSGAAQLKRNAKKRNNINKRKGK